MKKIIATLATAAFAAGLFAVDFSATVQMEGNLAKGKIDTNETTITVNDKTVTHNKSEDWNMRFFTINDKNQKDSDLLEVHFTGDKAGADFKFWAPASGGQLKVRGLKVWAQPIEMIKVSLGNIGISTPYVEKLDWYKVPNAADITKKGYSDKLGLKSDLGITLEANLPVMGGLTLATGVAPGKGAWFKAIADSSDKDNKEKNKVEKRLAYGFLAKLQATDAISVALSWRDDDLEQPKFLAVGAGFNGGESLPLEAFLNVIARIDNVENKYSWGFSGIAIDNYVAYDLGFMKIDGSFPVTIRGLRAYDTKAEKEADPCYMTAKLRAQIPMDALTIGFIVASDDVWTLDKDFGNKFNLCVNPYVEFNVGVCELSLGFEAGFALNNADYSVKVAGVESVTKQRNSTFHWAVPFTAKVSF